MTTLFKKPVKLHRLAWLMVNRVWPNGQIDHINGMKADNRIANLRVVNNSQNKQNVTAPVSNTSGYLGVSYHKKSGKWAANIKLNGRSTYLGVYDNPDIASKAYIEAKSRLHPFNEVYK